MLDSLAYDLAHAVRALRRSPGNTALAVTILGLAIGVNTALFSALNQVLVRPLPFSATDRIVRLREQVTGSDGQVHAFNMSRRGVLAVREVGDVFAGVVAFSADNMTLTGGEVAERVSVVLQTAGVEAALGVHPSAGRGFTREESNTGVESGVAIVSHALAQTRFSGPRGALGATLHLNGREFKVVGVMPPSYAFPYQAEVWLPIDLHERAGDPSASTPAEGRDYAVFARLRDGVTPARLQQSLAAVSARLRQQSRDVLSKQSIEVMTIRENLVGTEDAPLRALSLIVAVLLLLASVNVATLLVAQVVGRQREAAIRVALGAPWTRQLRQAACESLLLAAAGCLAGLIVASWCVPLTSALLPTVLSGELGLSTPPLDWRVVLFAMVSALASALVAAVSPHLVHRRVAPQAALTAGGRQMSTGVAGRRVLSLLIVAETALTVVLMAGAGLVIGHFLRAESLAIGFEPRHLLVVLTAPSAEAYAPGPARAALANRLLDEVAHAQGVVRAAITTVNPLGDGTWGTAIASKEMVAADPAAALNVNHRLVSAGLFETMKIPIERGRAFGNEDRQGGQPVVVISRRLARRLWPDTDPIGRQMRMARPDAPWLTVVGVAGDVADSHDPGVPLDTIYLPLAQHAASPATERFFLMLRTASDPLEVLKPVRRAAARVDSALALYSPSAMDRYRSDMLRRERVGAFFMLAFGSFGLLLAALGVYGVVAFGAAQRTEEFGIRLALGARATHIVPLVLRNGAWLVGLGLATGLAVAVAVNRIVGSVLAETVTLDLAVLAAAIVPICLVAVVASLVPALRACKLDPVRVLGR